MVTKTAKTKKMAAKPAKKVGEVGVVEKAEKKAEKKTVRKVVEVKPQQKVVVEEKPVMQERVEIKTKGGTEARPEIKPKTHETKTDGGAGISKAEKLVAKPRPALEKYYEAIGRRKEATARVRLYTKKSTDEMPSEDRAIMTVNGKPYFEYFRSPELYMTADAPLRKLKSINRFKATAKVRGGGVHGQADAIRHGLARALVMFDQNFSKKLRKAGYLTRDSRVKERRKYGLKKARKSPQWAKR